MLDWKKTIVGHSRKGSDIAAPVRQSWFPLEKNKRMESLILPLVGARPSEFRVVYFGTCVRDPDAERFTFSWHNISKASKEKEGRETFSQNYA